MYGKHAAFAMLLLGHNGDGVLENRISVFCSSVFDLFCCLNEHELECE